MITRALSFLALAGAAACAGPDTADDPPPSRDVAIHSPRWSPDGQWIAFYSDRDGAFDVYAVREDGLLQRITTGGTGGELDWSPAGGELVCGTTLDGVAGLHRIGMDGTARGVILAGERLGSPAWSPDGAWIAYEGRAGKNRDLFVVPAEGGEPRRVTTHEANDLSPSWSPDGERLAFSSRREGSYDVWTLDLATSEATPVTDAPTHETRPKWSPDGRRILYSVLSEDESTHEVVLQDLESGERTPLGPASKRDGDKDWSPDGKSVVYMVDEGGSMALRRKRVD